MERRGPRFRLPFRRRNDRAENDALTQELATPEAGGIASAAPSELPPSRMAGSFRAFQHRNYRIFYMGQSISLIGTWMQTIAQAWLVIEITDSQAALGVVAMLQFLPITVFVLWAGVIADRVPKRNFLILTQLLAMTQAIILAVLVITNQVELWHVYVLALMLGLSNAFDMPTRQAFAIEMVGREDLINAVSLNSGMFNAGRLIGPAVGGPVIALAGVEAVFLLNAVSFVPVLISLSLIRKSELFHVERRAATNPIRELREGISYAIHTPATLVVIILVALVGTFGYNFTVMIPLISRYVLHEGSVALGILTAAVGFGALATALVLAGRKSATHYQLIASAFAFSAFLGGVAISSNLYLTLVFLIGMGAAGSTFGTTANTALQIATPDHLRGRVVSLYMLLFAGSTPIGGFLMGWLAESLGTQWAIGLFAGLCMLGAIIGTAYYVSHRAAIDSTADAQKQAPAHA